MFLEFRKQPSVSQIQYWTSKINHIIIEICNIKDTFKNCKGNRNSQDKDVRDVKENKYSADSNLTPHDRTSNHNILIHHDPLPTHNNPNTYSNNPPHRQSHSSPDIALSGTEPTSSYGFPSSKVCTADTAMKPLSSPSDTSSLMNGSYKPSEEGVMGSSGGRELLDPDDGEETIGTSLDTNWTWMGEDERDVRATLTLDSQCLIRCSASNR